jgi:hypothetical protein
MLNFCKVALLRISAGGKMTPTICLPDCDGSKFIESSSRLERGGTGGCGTTSGHGAVSDIIGGTISLSSL